MVSPHFYNIDLFHRIHGRPTNAKMGRKPVFDADEEIELNEFLLDCWMLRRPRTKRMFGYDIQFRVNKTNKKNPFANGYPGNDIL